VQQNPHSKKGFESEGFFPAEPGVVKKNVKALTFYLLKKRRACPCPHRKGFCKVQTSKGWAKTHLTGL
jgi:hypothetical protein